MRPQQLNSNIELAQNQLPPPKTYEEQIERRLADITSLIQSLEAEQEHLLSSLVSNHTFSDSKSNAQQSHQIQYESNPLALQMQHPIKVERQSTLAQHQSAYAKQFVQRTSGQDTAFLKPISLQPTLALFEFNPQLYEYKSPESKDYFYSPTSQKMFQTAKLKVFQNLEDLKKVLEFMDTEYGVPGMHTLSCRGTKFIYCKCAYHGCHWENWFAFCVEVVSPDVQNMFNIQWYKQQGSKYHHVQAHMKGLAKSGPFI